MNILKPLRNDRGDGDGGFRMEFPLMQWMVAVLYKVFGNHLIISRIFMFVVGLFSIAGIYRLLERIFQNYPIALIGAWAFNFSPSFYYYTINPLPDNFALCCSIWGLALFFSWMRNGRFYLLGYSGLLLSIGALCKLPFILYFIVPFTYFLIEVRQKGFYKGMLIKGIAVFSLVSLPLAWYLYVVPNWQGNGIVGGLLNNKESWGTILDYFQHNLISTLPELLLNYGSVLFFIMGFYFIIKNKSFKNSMFPMFIAWSIAILIYFVFEINMIAKIHDYYLFPFYPILFILVSYGAYYMLCQTNRMAAYIVYFLLLILPVTAYLRMQVRWDLDSPGFNKDLLVFKGELRNATPKNALCVAGNDESHFIFFYYIDKKGWAFQDDDLNSGKLEKMIEKGAEYLYSDSRNIDQRKEIIPLLDKLILEKGSIRVYRLKRNNTSL